MTHYRRESNEYDYKVMESPEETSKRISTRKKIEATMEQKHLKEVIDELDAGFNWDNLYK